MPELYRLDFPNGRSFIGRTIYSARAAFGAHRRCARRGKVTPLHDAWRSLGEPRLVVLARLEHRELKPAADRAIRVYGTELPAGYNCPQDIASKLFGAF